MTSAKYERSRETSVNRKKGDEWMEGNGNGERGCEEHFAICRQFNWEERHS